MQLLIKNIFRISVQASLLAILLGASPISLANSPLAELEALLSGVETLQGAFQQQLLTGKGVVLQRNSGKMWLKKPGKFRWAVEGKDKRLVISDGRQIWDYDIELAQVTVHPLSQGQTSAPIFFLTGNTKALSGDFIVRPLSAQTLAGCDQCFELSPKHQQGAFQWIRIGFNKKTLQRLEVLDQLGQHAHFQFTQVVLNKNIPAAQFQFKPPQGVDILGL